MIRFFSYSEDKPCPLQIGQHKKPDHRVSVAVFQDKGCGSIYQSPDRMKFIHPERYRTMGVSSLSGVLLKRLPELVAIIDRLIRKTPLSPYQASVLETDSGKKRLFVWCERLIRTLDQGAVGFFDYQRQIGIERASRGYQMDGATQFYSAFLQAVWEICRKEKNGHAQVDWIWNDSELEQLHQTCLQGLNVFSNIYLGERESLLDESLSYLDNLHQYTHDIISRQSLDEISSLLASNVSGLFKVQGCSLLIQHDKVSESFNHPRPKIPKDILKLLKSVTKTGNPVFYNGVMEATQCREDENPVKMQVCLPIRARASCYGAFALYSREGGFEFAAKQLGILNQMLYITAVAIENCVMIQEIKQNRKELHALTGKIMTLQEEERKRVATDIHDTIAQTLTGVGYQMQYCKGLVRDDQHELQNNIEGALRLVDKAISQSRELIANLRPGLIDTVGLVPALHQLLDQFTEETEILIERVIPDNVDIMPESSICLYRVLQSALSNIFRHAGVKKARVTVTAKGKFVQLTVSDRGKGFDPFVGWSSFKNPDKFGLLGMKERVETAGGMFRLKAARNKGCLIQVKIPANKSIEH